MVEMGEGRTPRPRPARGSRLRACSAIFFLADPVAHRRATGSHTGRELEPAYRPIGGPHPRFIRPPRPRRGGPPGAHLLGNRDGSSGVRFLAAVPVNDG